MDHDSNLSDSPQPGTSRQPPCHPTSDWSLCILCQSKTAEALQCPGNYRRPDCGTGYSTVARNLERFEELGNIPLQLNLLRLEEGKGIEHCLKSHKASWHKSCSLKFNSTKVKRAEKRQATTCSSESVPVKYTRKYGTVSSKTISCFICEKSKTVKDF